MANMTVSLPDPMKEWVDAQTRSGEYASSSDYVHDLIRRDREKKERLDGLRALIDDAEASGVGSRTVDEIFAEAPAIARSRGMLPGTAE